MITIKSLFSFVCPLLLCSLFSAAQELPLQTVNSGGSSESKSGLQIEYSVGEIAVGTRAASGYVLTQGFVQPVFSAAVLPVTLLEFVAKRLNAQQVRLNWKTAQETSNKGFTIERRRENESHFFMIAFAGSLAPNGNTSLPLSYTQLDTNVYAGRTFYRLRQQDINGQYSYSFISTVSGSVSQTLVLKAWPIPAQKEFSVTLSGISRTTVLVYDASGGLVKQHPIADGEVLKITNLLPGHYLLTLEGQKEVAQKIIVQ